MNIGYIFQSELNRYAECYTSNNGNLVTGILISKWNTDCDVGYGYWEIYHDKNSNPQKLAFSISRWALRNSLSSAGKNVNLEDDTTLTIIKYKNEEVRN